MHRVTFLSAVLYAGIALTLFGSAVSKDVPAPPTFAKAYVAKGFILLPYANLKEPFTAFYDSNQNKSRIDYYDDLMQTFQIATKYTKTSSAGAAFKLVWSPNEKTHDPERICYQANGTDAAPTAIQTVFPDLTGFKYAGSENCSKGSNSPADVIKGTCDVWTQVNSTLGRNNNYTLWAQKNKDGAYNPARYVMFGFDSLIGSHYDEYELIYTSYKEGEQNEAVFDVVHQAPAGECVAYPAGSGLSADHLFNPMKEFVHRNEDHLHEQFKHFKLKHGKKYINSKDEAVRKNNFRHNQRFINSQNRKNKHFELAINHLADWDRDEIRYLRGARYGSKLNQGKRFQSAKFDTRNVQKDFDWRTRGVVSKVKDQAICGSCWSFGTTGHLESQYALKYGKNVSFAEQQLVDCSWNYGNGGCDGGEDFQAYHYIMKYGLATEKDYSPYLGVDGKCKDKKTNMTLKTLLGYVNVQGVDNLKTAVTYIGPISVGIDAAHQTFSFYSRGIFNDPECKNGRNDLDHAVLAVGYGTSASGVDYWIIKNSWSTHWGDNGFIKMASKNNLCGVATAATYAILP